MYDGLFKMERLTKEERTIIRSRLTQSLAILCYTKPLSLKERAFLERLYIPKLFGLPNSKQCLVIRGEHLVYCTRAVTTQEGKEVQRKLGLLPPAANYWGFSSMTNAQSLLLPTTCILRTIQRGSRLGGPQCLLSDSECSGPVEMNSIRTRMRACGQDGVPFSQSHVSATNRRLYRPAGGEPIEPQGGSRMRASATFARLKILPYREIVPLSISRSLIWRLDRRQITLCKYHSLGF